jgi:hypothetical protein
MGKFLLESEDDLQGGWQNMLRVDLMLDVRRLRGVVDPLIDSESLRLRFGVSVRRHVM